jgi:hypothetical protein
MMADPKVLNQAQINAATAAKRAATAKAEAAKAIGAPIAQKVIPTIPKTAAALNALAKAMQGNDPKAIDKARAAANAAIAANKSSATKEELATAKQSTLDYQKYLDEAESINIPGAVYAAAEEDTALEARKSAYNLLMEEFTRYGLGALVEDIKGLVQENVSPSEFTLRLRQTDAYKKRFAANAQRIAKGLGAISEAEYIGLEDQYQNVMRQYGLPDTYYTKGDMGRQEGFEKFISNDVSAVELEDRIATAQNRVINANPEVSRALKEFYPDITNGDILAYTLDPKNAIKNIQRKVTAAEIGGAAMGQGLQTSLSRAEELAAAGIDKAAAQQGYQTVAEVSPRGSLLSDIYKQSPYGQVQAEQEVFNLAGSAEAARQRKKLTSLETAAFSGQAGVGALARERAGNI